MIDAIDDAYIYTKSGELSKTYKQRHRCLDQIRAHDYRRPIPEPFMDKLKIMLERFKNYPFEMCERVETLSEWILHYVTAHFQVEHFWQHESGSECRAKFDMIWIWESDGVKWALPFDLKVTANWLSFTQNWKYRYIWQSKHYLEGFKKWCAENGYTPYGEEIWYLVQESAEPQITHAWALSEASLSYLDDAYNAAIPQIWEWMDAGKKVKGYVEQQKVNIWGKNETTI
jgi:hypothetical protein